MHLVFGLRESRQKLKALKRFLVFISVFAVIVASNTRVLAQESKPDLDNHSVPNSLRTCVDFRPYFIDENGQKKWLGRHTHFMYQVLRTAGFELEEPKRDSFGNCLELMKSGGIDVMAGLLYSTERAEYMDFLAYTVRDPIAVFYLPKRKSKIDTGRNLLIAFERGYILPTTIAKSFEASEFIDVTSLLAGLQLLERERVDGFVAPLKTIFEIISEQNMDKNKFEYQMFSQAGDQVHIGLSQKSLRVNDKVKDRIAAAIQTLQNNGTMINILEQK